MCGHSYLAFIGAWFLLCVRVAGDACCVSLFLLNALHAPVLVCVSHFVKRVQMCSRRSVRLRRAFLHEVSNQSVF